MTDERHHHLGLHAHPFLRKLARRLENSPGLHLGDFGIRDAEPASPVAEHGIDLVKGFDLRLDHAQRDLHLPGHLFLVFLLVRHELMQGWIEEPDRDPEALHRLEYPVEVFPLHPEKLCERLLSSRQVFGEDHLAHRLDTVALEEHMLGAAQADPLGAEAAGDLRVMGRIRVGAHAERTYLIRPFHDGPEVPGKLRIDRGHLAEHDVSGAAVEGDKVALFYRFVVCLEYPFLIINLKLAAAGHAAFAHAARDDRRVRRHAPPGREDPL